MTLPWNTFKADEVPEQENSYEPLPAGQYPMMATAYEQKTSKKDPNSWYLNVTFTIAEGRGEGRKVFSIFNLGNTNEEAKKIAEREFAQFCMAIKQPVVTDPSEILDKPFVAKLVIKKDEQYGDKNEIKGYSQYGDVAQALKPQAASGEKPKFAWKQ